MEEGARDPGESQNADVRLTPDQVAAISSQISNLLTDKCASFINSLVRGQTGKNYDAKKDLLDAIKNIANGSRGFFSSRIFRLAAMP